MSQVNPLHETDLFSDPFAQFEQWFSEAQQSETSDPTAMVLSTVDQQNRPDSRVVLLRGLQENQFIFYTNYHSTKGCQLAHNPHAALNFHWANVQRQVRIRGTVTMTTADVSNQYFAQRPHGSQVAAVTSQQSAPVADRQTLERQFQDRLAQYPDEQPVPRPPHWGGYMLKPFSIEFWQARENRFHDRFLYVLTGNTWHVERLYP